MKLLNPIFLIMIFCRLESFALASDHADSPAVLAQPEMDLTNFYVYKNKVSDSKINFILNVNAHHSGDISKLDLFDDTGRYAIFIDSEGDQKEDVVINIFLNDSNDRYVFFVDKTAVSGAFGEVSQSKGIKAFVGFRDDPTFLDFEGFANFFDSFCVKDGGYSGIGLRCDNTGSPTNFYKAYNIGVLAIQVPIELISSDANGKIRVWAKSFKRVSEGK